MNFPSYKRIKKEFDIILDRYQNCSIVIDNDNKYQNYILTVKLKDPKVDIVLHYPSEYPFKPPNMFINKVDYKSMVCIGDKYILNELHKINKRCLCHYSLICYSNWSPAINSIRLIDEYLNNRKLIQGIIYKRYISLICNSNKLSAQEYKDLIFSYL
jgi:ubiquitin-protein ligase